MNLYVYIKQYKNNAFKSQLYILKKVYLCPPAGSKFRLSAPPDILVISLMRAVPMPRTAQQESELRTL